MELEPAACRLCGDTRIRCLGTIPDSDYFAGRVLELPINGGHLWACDGCQSMFRHPVLRPSAYLDLYAGGAADEYGSDDGRQDLAIIRSIIAQKARPGGVLDVGCGAGDFLVTLPAELTKYGVEPSIEAAAAATRRGVSIPAPTLAQLTPQAAFDVITIIDVIEHVASPGDLLDQALPHLAPGGALIIATGDAGNMLWRRFFRSRFWYSSFPEHISFPSTQYFQIWHEGRGFQVPTVVQLKYRRIPFCRAALHFGSQLAYLASPWLLNHVGRAVECLRRAPRPRRRFFSPGAPGVFTDHQIVVIQRQSRGGS
jgi:SAM-dependent methyltransferase